jgi:hypothetical protein
LKQFLLTLCLTAGISTVLIASLPVSKSISIKKLNKTSRDTSDINRYARNALAYVSKPLKIEYIKANIDSAESICKKENIDMPALLHLARAEYFVLTGDYNNASQEAKTAVRLSENSGETEILASDEFSWKVQSPNRIL